MDTPNIHDSKVAVELVEWYLKLLEGFNNLPTEEFVRTFYSQDAQISGPYGHHADSSGLIGCFDTFKHLGVKTFKVSHIYDMGNHCDDIAYIGVLMNSVDAKGKLVEQMKIDTTMRKEQGVWKVYRESWTFSLDTPDVFDDDSKVLLGRAFNLNNDLSDRRLQFVTKEDPNDAPND